MTITIEAIRAAGGIVHSDGNIFFRDISMLQGLAGAAPAAVAGPAHWEANDDSRPRSRSDLARVLDEWNEATGCIPRMSSWRVEVLSIIEDAFDLGIFLGEKAHLAPALEAPAAVAGEWQLVPTNPTAAMAKAYDNACFSDYFRSSGYKAMLAAAPQAPAAPGAYSRGQHDADSRELRSLCIARDAARRERDLARVEIAGLQASTGHLSALVDGQQALLEKAKATMKALHGSASPIDESRGDFDARIPASAFARFVDEHAALLYALAQSPVAAPAAPAVDAALNALIADVRALPTLRASEIDGEESDGTPKHWRNRPFVSLRKLELLLRDRVTASSDTALLNFIAAEYLDLRSFGMPTGQGDADVGWRVIQHHMGEPTERVVAEVYKDDPRSAIRAAIARLERDPYCTGALHEEDAAQAKEGGEAC